MKNFLLFLFLGFFLFGCNADELEFKNVKLEPVEGMFAVPLGDITYTMKQLIDKAGILKKSLKEDSSGLYSVSYVDDLFSYTDQDEFVQINGTKGSGVLKNTLPPTGIIVNPIETRSISDKFSFFYDSQDSQELDSLFHSGGQITATFTSNAMVSEVEFVLRFENTMNVNTQIPISLSEKITTMPTTAGQNVSIQSTANLNNHVTRLTNTTNEFDVFFGATFTLVAGQELNGSESISFDFSFGNQTFSVIYGKFGQDTVQLGSEIILLDFYNDLDEGIFVNEPTIKIEVENSFGIPIAFDFSSSYGENENGGNKTFFDGVITNPRFFPEIPAASDINTTATKIVEINSTNSNLRDILAKSPSRLVFNIVGRSNLNDAKNQESNFIEPDNFIKGLSEINLPLEIRLEDFKDTAYLETITGIKSNRFDSAFVRVVTINELPFSGTFVIEIKDENKKTVFSSTEEVIAAMPLLDLKGEVADPSGNSVDIPISKEGLHSFIENGVMNLILTLNSTKTKTANQIYVKIRAQDKINIKIGLGVLAKFEKINL